MIELLSEASGRNVSRETFERLDLYVRLVEEENARQNLVARSTLPEIWSRHVVDSAQLLRFAPGESSRWLDIGSGAGLPGMVLAIITGAPFTLVEPRRLRAEFLQRCAEEIGLGAVTVMCSKVSAVTGKFDAITARAVASVGNIFEMAWHLASPTTRWILPKGRSAAKELAEAQASWQGRFRTLPSFTAEDAVILVAEGVEPKGRTRGRG